MTKDEALKLALEALERCVATCFDPYAHEQVMSWPEHFVNQTITAIKEALAQPEPWEKFCDSNCVWTDHHPDCKLAQRTWVGLNDEDYKVLREGVVKQGKPIAWMIEQIEAKLKEKNT